MGIYSAIEMPNGAHGSPYHSVSERLYARAEKAEVERDEARAERDSWRTLAEGWKLTDDVEQHRV